MRNPPDAARAPMDATTTFFPPTFRTSSKISWDGPTPPPGVLSRRTIAFTESSFENFLSCSIVSPESTISPVIGSTATLSPRAKANHSVCDRTTSRTKNPARTRTMIRHPRRNGCRALGGL